MCYCSTIQKHHHNTYAMNEFNKVCDSMKQMTKLSTQCIDLQNLHLNFKKTTNTNRHSNKHPLMIS